MKKLILFTGLIFLIPAVHLHSQDLLKNSRITGVCYAGNKVKRIYIPPPKSFFQREALKGTSGSITIYYTNVPTWTKTVVNYAASILESILPPDTKITAIVTAGSMTSGVLANSSTGGFADGREIDALYPDAYYPVALAEKIYGEQLNHEMSGDVYININTDVNWYVGTDGNTPSTQYDLVTVIIHEFIHGLGFFDSMYANASTGTWGADSRPLIYDTFVENIDGNKLIDTLLFLNPSAELKEQITSGN